MAKQAVENDAHVIGMSTKDPGHATLLPELVKELKGLDREDIMVIVGGVISAQDYAPCATFCMETGLRPSSDRGR
uniref:Methylmalonyl-CoA mutase C-terminal domain-containing protein n=1 Tax=Candidatus Kentrum eta TaxID=2126337 RepID=A0A450UV29_9GAMM|nr:MAG: methylmalonyl-CoA mutase C-terminal domain-containing protein [Candidatus Kentron sp. H]VFJ96345.1 MAG: methylmalonyl-CoA mutase C-terminal domain-containing protein [Candidatus Kentron sp. H]VFK05199.1 MAG: methylmalonyl-CoA mutase C-terminal domain-containing protein [Candidatus Kentron sp. H]